VWPEERGRVWEVRACAGLGEGVGVGVGMGMGDGVRVEVEVEVAGGGGGGDALLSSMLPSCAGVLASAMATTTADV
jgi:hypothetical protein